MHTEEEKSTPDQLVPQSQEREHLYTLQPKMQRFIQLYMTGQYSMTKVASLLDVHVNTAYGWLKREDVQLALKESQESIHFQVDAELKALTMKATRKLMELVDSPIDAVSLQAVKDVLDRGGHKAKQEIKVDKTITTIEEKMKSLIESTIDAEFEEVAE